MKCYVLSIAHVEYRERANTGSDQMRASFVVVKAANRERL